MYESETATLVTLAPEGEARVLHFSFCFTQLMDKSATFYDTNATRIRGKTMSDEVTLVTAYFNIGAFRKGHGVFVVENYVTWMNTFSIIGNPVYAFFDDENIRKAFLDIRRNFPRSLTKTELVKRKDLWAFRQLDEVRDIFKRGYPRHPPSTTVPEYPCIMHAKYELVNNAARRNVFNTKYIAWVDVGYFRRNISNTPVFSLWLPPNFNDNQIAYSRLRPRNRSLSPHDIVKYNAYWVAGGLFIGRVNLMIDWTREYMDFTDILRTRYNITGTDQHTLYAMFNLNYTETNVQEYRHRPGDINAGGWVYLGALCRAEGVKRQRSRDSLIANNITSN